MARLEELLAIHVQDVFGNQVDGLTWSLANCRTPGADYMAFLLNFLCKEHRELNDCDRDALFCTAIKNLLQALNHWNIGEGKSAFTLLCKCISVCIKSSKKCSEILHSYLARNLQNCVAKVTESDISLWEETEDKQLDYCKDGIATPIITFFRLLFELTTENVCEKENSFGIFDQEIFNALLQVLAVDGDEAILPLLSQIIKLHIIHKESKMKEFFAKLCEIQSCQEAKKSSVYAVACLTIDELLHGNSYDIRNEENLRLIVQDGLASDDSLSRKRAMYLLKKVVEVSHSDFKQWTMLNDFILLFEILEEKQLHVILPVLPTVANILELSQDKGVGNDVLHFSWLSTILLRGLNHDNRLVTRWAIHTILDLEVKYYKFFQNKNWIYIIDPLLCALREYHLFERETGMDSSECPTVVMKFSGFLLKCQSIDCDYCHQVEFFRKIIGSLCLSGYNAIAFPYIAEAISVLALPGVVNSELLSVIKVWILSETSTFPTELRVASFHHLLKIIRNFLSKDEVSLVEFIKLSKAIFEQGCLFYGNELWCDLISVVRDSIFSSRWQHGMDEKIGNFENLKELCLSATLKFLDGKCEIFETAQEIGLVIFVAIDVLSESGIETAAQFIECVLWPFFDVLTKFGRTPYVNKDKSIRSLLLINFIIKWGAGIAVDHRKDQNVIHKKLFEMSGCILSIHRTILENAFNGCNTSIDLGFLSLELNSTVCDFLKLVSKDSLLIENLKSILKICTNYMKKVIEDRIVKNNCLLFKSLEMILSKMDGTLKTGAEFESLQLEYDLLEMIRDISLDHSVYLDLHLRNSQSTSDSLQATCSFNHDIMNALWTLVSFAVKKEECQRLLPPSLENKHLPLKSSLTLSVCSLTELVHKVIEAIDVSVGNAVIPLLECFQYLMPHIIKSSKNLSVIVLETVWRLFKEQERRDSRFWKIFVPCVNVLFHKSVLLGCDKELLDKLTEFWRFVEDIGQKKSGIFNVVVKHCCEIWEDCLLGGNNTGDKHYKSMFWCIDLLVDACAFGHVQKKAARITQQTIKYFSVKFVSEKEASRNVNIDYQVRWIVIRMMLKINENSEQSLFVIEVMKNLIEKDRRISEKVKRYYDNSLTHRQKLRIWQTMLMLVKFIKEGNAREIMSKMLSVMISENQPSIRYYVEWFAIILVHKVPPLVSVIWQKLSEASERRVCSITCLMSIIMHLAVSLPDREFSEMAAEAFIKILPWVQIHHMQARVHAQIVMWKLWEELKRRQCPHLLKEYQLIESLFSLDETNASVFKAREEIKNHFYFKYFHPINHFSLETIYCSMPKLLNIGDDEVLSQTELIEMTGGGDTLYGIKILSKSESLSSLVTVIGQNDEEKVDERKDLVKDNLKESKNYPSNVQKKIVAWKPLPPSDDPFLQKADMYKKEMQRSELVFCASLIDRTPNLGGICRTCEIFGVSTLVVGAMRFIDDSSFKSLSVTAEKWMNIEQVLPHHLEVYLKEMKDKGYRLVGVEQTTNSISLEDYKFQEKTLLLLGNEREGIPVELIHILDDCVEIPQQGVIRSLNVHVSGAIITWEYCKQMMLEHTKLSA